MKTKAEKEVQLAEIKKLFAEAKGAVLVDFSGLTVAEDTELRRKVREAGASYTVYKNTLIALAAKEYGLDDLAPVLEKNTAICSSSQDAVAACKVMCDFVKDHKKMQLKAGVVEGKVIAAERSAGCQNAGQPERSYFRPGSYTQRNRRQDRVCIGCSKKKKRKAICIMHG